MPRQKPQRRLQLPAANPLLEPAIAGLEWWKLLRQFPPLSSRVQHPEHSTQHRLYNRLLFFGQPQSPVIAAYGNTQRPYRMRHFQYPDVYETSSGRPRRYSACIGIYSRQPSMTHLDFVQTLVWAGNILALKTCATWEREPPLLNRFRIAIDQQYFREHSCHDHCTNPPRFERS